MVEKNCEMLFQYLRSILYDQKIKELDIESLDEPFRDLGRGLQVLQQSVEEMLKYTEELSVGHLTGFYPSRDNFLCVNLKNLHANLNHLTWQAQQVAKGDYSQQVVYLGAFQEAFNEMTKQLKEREDQLKEETKKLQHQTEVISSYNEAFIEMARMREEVIAVICRETGRCVYCNRQMIHVSGGEREERPYICSYSFYDRLIHWDGDLQLVTWEARDASGLYFRIITFPIVWQGEKAWCHTIVDITKEKLEQDKLTDIAYHDPGTRIFNRRYFDEYMDHMFRSQCDATLCYLDLDGLKYVNDHFGHEEGDHYLLNFVHMIQNSFRSEDILARVGGDEFALILYGCHQEMAERKLANVLERFMAASPKGYLCSFSYGVVEINGKDQTLTLDEIIRQADTAMYTCKREHKSDLSRQKKAAEMDRKDDKK